MLRQFLSLFPQQLEKGGAGSLAFGWHDRCLPCLYFGPLEQRVVPGVRTWSAILHCSLFIRGNARPWPGCFCLRQWVWAGLPATAEGWGGRSNVSMSVYVFYVLAYLSTYYFIYFYILYIYIIYCLIYIILFPLLFGFDEHGDLAFIARYVHLFFLVQCLLTFLCGARPARPLLH